VLPDEAIEGWLVMSELEVARVVLVKREDVSELVVDDADDFLCGKILGINPDAVDGLIATGVLMTPDGVGVEGVSGTTLVCTSNGLTSSTLGVT
jgi:hypothetical protein